MRRATSSAGPAPRRYALVLLGGLACALLAPRGLGAADAPVTVIAHPSRAAPLSQADARAIYLKQKLYWPDGQAIVPINRESGSATRERFSERLFGQSSRRLADYWNQRYFEAGEFPPATLASDDAVRRFVAAHRNAIGYVTPQDADDSVVVVLQLD
jgi:ABC-type phosphate transport system substrate-binding protein